MSALLTSLRAARTLSTSVSPLQAARSPLLATAAAMQQHQRRGLAKLTLIGNLVAAPAESSPSESGAGASDGSVSNVVSYVVAVNHNVAPGSTAASASFFRVACINPNERRRAALMNVPKGSLVYVEGLCRYSRYTNAEGKEDMRLSIVQDGPLRTLRRKQPVEEEGSEVSS